MSGNSKNLIDNLQKVVSGFEIGVSVSEIRKTPWMPRKGGNYFSVRSYLPRLIQGDGDCGKLYEESAENIEKCRLEIGKEECKKLIEELNKIIPKLTKMREQAVKDYSEIEKQLSNQLTLNL